MIQPMRRVPVWTTVLLMAIMTQVLAHAPLAWGQQGGEGGESLIVPGRYIVVLKDSVDHPGAVAESQAERHDGLVRTVYRYAIKGYAATLPTGAAKALRSNPNVKYVVPDGRIKGAAQTLPTGVSRISAPSVPAADIDEQDDVRVDVDVAVIDSGIDAGHPDLNVAGRTDCTVGPGCVDGSGTDEFGHGTHVAGIIGALDNDFGSVGVAPGARLWSVKALDASNSGFWSWAIAGVDWVTAHSGQIEVANMSLGAQGQQQALEEAIEASVDAGVVYVVAAGNENIDAGQVSPASFEDVIAVSALADYDGLAGGLGTQWCSLQTNLGPDDELAPFSNWGSAVDIAAPGTCIYSTLPTYSVPLGSNYGAIGGTSMAAPHVAGAAALLASESNPDGRPDVEAIRASLLERGSLNWNDPRDDIHEPLLDLRPPTPEALTTAASGLEGSSARLNAVVSPGGVASSYRFEYGTSTSYGQSAPASPRSVGSGIGDLEVSETVSLEPDLTYHYRVVLTNGQETFYGADRTFKSSRWMVQEVPVTSYGETPSYLSGVSCAAPSSCMAVGRKVDATVPTALAERWDGREWKIVMPPVPSGTLESRLNDVSCASSTSCMAVGFYRDSSGSKPLSLRWDGSSWTLLINPVPAEAKGDMELRGVSCPATNTCTAVGSYRTTSVLPLSSQQVKTLVQVWNGTGWSIQGSPNAEGRNVSLLNAVSCSSATACTAVGTAKTSPAASASSTTLAARWNGTSWSLQAAPAPSGATQSTLEDIACTSASLCIAVGFEGESARHGFTASWNGAWQLGSSNLPQGLYGVSCSSPNSCYAGGEETARYWNGTSWQVRDFAFPSHLENMTLNEVSCASATACFSVGGYSQYRRLQESPLIERLAPQWSLQSTPAPPPVTESAFEDVSCASPTLCMAVGNANKSGASLASWPEGVVQTWNGAAWSLRQAPTAGPLFGVSCVPGTAFCVTVGRTSASEAPVIEHWSGTSSTRQAAPAPSGATQVKLEDVSCFSESACTAVGSFYGAGYTPLALRWNGTQWSLQSAPGAEGTSSELRSVSCASTTSCMAVGSRSGSNLAFAERWDGSEWAIVAIPLPAGSSSTLLEDVSCASTTSCMAVGWQLEGSARKPFAVRWNGSSWSVIPAPTPSDAKGATELRGVSCASASACTAIGAYTTTSALPLSAQEYKTLAETWNGSAWSLQASPNPEGRKLNYLSAVSCSEAFACTAVGRSKKSNTEADTALLAGRME